MDKTINLIIEETKDEIISLINSKLQMGLPISVVNIVLENIYFKIENEKNKVLNLERNNLKKDVIPNKEG